MSDTLSHNRTIGSGLDGHRVPKPSQALAHTNGRIFDKEIHADDGVHIRKNIWETTPNTAASLDGVAWLYNCKGQYEEAVSLCQRALAIRKKALEQKLLDAEATINSQAALRPPGQAAAPNDVADQRNDENVGAIAALPRKLRRGEATVPTGDCDLGGGTWTRTPSNCRNSITT
ncbi:hypothetical protein BC936DRAFT_148891 [Jimgerdemannia flammicorona]|uniref:Uncharacterized protein n=1 Tax=Jimgerdemannia flammicorona TaxID=994334 RepID=A0A433D230_9FUNG|nr:hypothetical protein BC936DRAFT_148891 [Jimgerdemannia flammicorona]